MNRVIPDPALCFVYIAHEFGGVKGCGEKFVENQRLLRASGFVRHLERGTLCRRIEKRIICCAASSRTFEVGQFPDVFSANGASNTSLGRSPRCRFGFRLRAEGPLYFDNSLALNAGG